MPTAMRHSTCLFSLLALSSACVDLDDAAVETPDLGTAEQLSAIPDPFPAHLQVGNLNSNGLGNGGCLDLPLGAGTPVGLQQFPCNSGDNQRWRFEPVGTGVFRIHSSRNFNLCLDAPNIGSEQLVQVAACNTSNNQLWFVEQVLNPYGARIKPILHIGLCLDVQWGVQREQAPIWLYTCTNSGPANLAQRFTFRTHRGNVSANSCGGILYVGGVGAVSPGNVMNSSVAAGTVIDYKCGLNGSWKQVSIPNWTNFVTIDRRSGGSIPISCFSN
jgi:hypothetical protein